MPHYPSVRIINFALASLLGLGLSGCVAYTPYRSGYVYQSPPAVGVTYYDYWYYPSAQVYFDTNRRVYFYFSNDRWIETRVLPLYWRTRLGNHVPIQSRYTRPYMEHNEHIRRYPSQYRDERRMPERQDDRYRANPPAYREAPRNIPPQERNQEYREERNRPIERYNPKEAPRNLPPQGRSQENRDRQTYPYNPKFAPKAKPSVPQHREEPRGNSKDKNKQGKDTRDNRHKQSQEKNQRDDREQDRRDNR